MDWINELLYGFNKYVRQDNPYDINNFSKEAGEAAKTVQSTMAFSPETGSKKVKAVNINKGNMMSGALGQFNSMIPEYNQDPLTQGLNKGYDALADAAGAIPGYGTLISGVMKGVSFANKGLATLTNGATTIEKPVNTADKILSSNFFALQPIGLANSLTKTTVKGSDANIANSITMGYQPTEGLAEAQYGGVTRGIKKLFTGKDDAKTRQKRVDRINSENAIKSSIVGNSIKNTTASSNTTQDIINKNRQALLGGQNTNIVSAKKGTKLSKLKSISEKVKRNVIPSGALHARKNNLPEDIAKDVTNKGIPVVSAKEEGGLIQHAEIEHSEIIFNKDVTNKIEALWKEFKNGNENAAVEAGKLLTYEILENTDDNTNLINTIQ